MHVNEATLSYQLLWIEASDQLTTTRQRLTYLLEGTPEVDTETFWILCMNPKHRPICRSRLCSGPIVATQVNVRDVFLLILLAEAKAFACLRTEPHGQVRPNLADARLLGNLRDTARLMNLEFTDYLIAPTRGRGYYSWLEHDRRVA